MQFQKIGMHIYIHASFYVHINFDLEIDLIKLHGRVLFSFICISFNSRQTPFGTSSSSINFVVFSFSFMYVVNVDSWYLG